MLFLYKIYLLICLLIGFLFSSPADLFATQLDQIVANDVVVIERLTHIENVLSVLVGTTCIVSLLLAWSVIKGR